MKKKKRGWKNNVLGQEAAGASLFVLSLAPASGLMGASTMIPTVGEIGSIGGLIRNAPAGSRALTLVCAAAWRMAAFGGDNASGQTLAALGG